MNKIIKENWFKIVVTFAIIVIIFFLGYHFIIDLPRQGELYGQEKCSAQAIKTLN